MTKQRLDTLLAERGLFPSRTRAAASVMAGEVCVGPDRRRALKPGELVELDAQISVQQQPSFVSRGGVKLANALAASGLEVSGRWALDVGSSTGGFTDCLLQRGAGHVTAVDVGYGELAWSLRTDPRVTVLERTNARTLTPETLARARACGTRIDGMNADGDTPSRVPDLATIDVSFISLTKVLPSVLSCLGPAHDVLALVKPQFEVGRERVGKGGVVRSQEDRRAALVQVGRAALELGEGLLGFHPSGLPGPKGNLETFAWIVEGDRPGAVHTAEGVQRMASEVSA